MKLFALLFGMIAANPMMNFLLMDQLSEDGDDSLMKMLLFSPGLLGGHQEQSDQMNSLLPFLLMDSDGDDNSKVILMKVGNSCSQMGILFNFCRLWNFL